MGRDGLSSTARQLEPELLRRNAANSNLEKMAEGGKVRFLSINKKIADAPRQGLRAAPNR
jgi:hypothetical protein